MKKTLGLALCLLFTFATLVTFATICLAQRSSPANGRTALTGVPDNPQAVGEAGVAWYTTWEKGLEEAKRSNRPIFFMAAATTCSGVSGVF